MVDLSHGFFLSYNNEYNYEHIVQEFPCYNINNCMVYFHSFLQGTGIKGLKHVAWISSRVLSGIYNTWKNSPEGIPCKPDLLPTLARLAGPSR